MTQFLHANPGPVWITAEPQPLWIHTQELLHEESRTGVGAHLARKCSESIICEQEFDTCRATSISRIWKVGGTDLARQTSAEPLTPHIMFRFCHINQWHFQVKAIYFAFVFHFRPAPAPTINKETQNATNTKRLVLNLASFWHNILNKETPQ